MSIEQIETSRPLLSPDKPEIGAYPAQCPVIGLGASAGGLEAFQNFLTAVPPDSGHAYVLVQHLDPNHESMLAELLSRRTSMPVRQVSDGMTIEPNHVYLIPPNASLAIEKATLKLTDFSEPRGFRRPIDVFFRSLAVDQGTNAACIVLSGTGGDGSEGLRAVKEAGGLTLVQEPESAKYDGMPKSAVATGLVDKVLNVHEMPGAISDYFNRSLAGAPEVAEDTDFLPKVCEELRHRLGHDFSQYKRSTMQRRVQRRMQVVAAATADAYLERLRGDAAEADMLFRDLLINVTCFFRDADAFDYLRREVIPKILKDKGAGDVVRIWTPACSSGEEAYSIAILISEALARQDVRPRVQIFATDIDEPVLQKARAAHYPHSAVKDVPLELLDRYFYAQEDDYVLVQPIRDMVRVSNHNLITDPPFSRVDMIVCRNLLIYLNPVLQQRLVPVFHYALRAGGWLFLGSAENIASRNDLFDTMDGAARIFRRKAGHRQSVAMPLSSYPLVHAALAENGAVDRIGSGNIERPDAVMRRVMDLYAPPHVVVNANYDIVRSSRRTGRYLELSEGAPSTKITDLAKRGLRTVVRSLLDTVQRTGRTAVKRDVRLRDGEGEDEKQMRVHVTADPLANEHVLLVFQEVGSEREDIADIEIDHAAQEDAVKQLEDELDETRSKLRTTVEELETSNEELKSTNEEMMSMNEELQSTNEELATVNEELKNKVDQLGRTYADLQNFVESTQVPTIFLDKKLRIRSFTPATKALFRFQDQDKGRPLSDLVTRTDRQVIEDLGHKVLETGEALEQELAVENGQESYVLRALPYRGVDETIDGVILVFSDVTKIRQTQADLARNEGIARQRSHEIEKLYKTAPVGMALIDRNRRCLKINQRFADMNGRAVEDHVGRTLKEVAPRLMEQMDRPIQEVFESGEDVANLEATLGDTAETLRDFLIDIYPYEEGGRVTAVGVLVNDVTEIRRLERELRRLMDELQHRVKNTLATVTSIINRTAGSKTDRYVLADTLKRRIGALAATHDLLTTRDWQGASLRQIIETELKPFGHTQRVVLTGPTVDLPPKHALALTLTLHELATNAAKYGALSDRGGTLTVSWTVNLDSAGRRLTLDWAERCAEPCPVPVGEGFGMQLIKNAVPHDLQGHCEHKILPEGVMCKMTVPF
ncbi:MAG: chemotaxis protein CheB [Rhodospirillaceae bacterium]